MEKMDTSKNVSMHAKECLGFKCTCMEKKTKIDKIVPSSSVANIKEIKRCNSLPLFISNTLHCDWNKKNTYTFKHNIISNSFRQSVNSTDATSLNYPLYNQPETKSLQELQMEVDALLEFRDLVIETFPDLKYKMMSLSSAAMIANNSKIHTSPSRNAAKKKKLRKDAHSSFNVQGPSASTETVVIRDGSSAFLSRSRSNSNSCKKEPKSGEISGSVVQDSGFSTETTSSKDGHSGSSTVGIGTGLILPTRGLHDSDDELLNLLEVIHRKTSKFRQKFTSMQNYERDKYETSVYPASIPNVLTSSKFHRKLVYDESITKKDLTLLQKERDELLCKVAESESEMLEGRIKISHMEKQLEQLTSSNNTLEDQLKAALSHNQELSSILLRCESDSPSRKCSQWSDSGSMRDNSKQMICKKFAVNDANRSLSFKVSFKSSDTDKQKKKIYSAYADSEVSGLNFNSEESSGKKITGPMYHSMSKSRSDVKTLGKLDGIVSSPKCLSKVQATDSKKVAAILLETDTIELQRHLLTLIVQNQNLMQRLGAVQDTNHQSAKQFGGFKEEMTVSKLQIRSPPLDQNENKIFQSLKNRQTNAISMHHTKTSHDTKTFTSSSVSLYKKPELKESYVSEETFQPPKRSKPSKIPLPGTRTIYASRSNDRSSPLTTLHKSLSYSTGNIYFKNNANKINRQNSLFMKSRTLSTTFSDKKYVPRDKFVTSPLPKLRRDSVTARVRQINNLSAKRNSNNPNEKNHMNQKSSPSSQLSAQNKINSLFVSSAVNNSPTSSPSRSISIGAKKEEGLPKTNYIIHKDPHNKKTSGNSARGGGVGSASHNISITNSSVNSSLAIDEQYNDSDIGRVRNLRSALLGWLKI